MSDINSFSPQNFKHRKAMRPTARTWVKHLSLLLITLVTCTIAGVIQPFGTVPFAPQLDPQTWTEVAFALTQLPALYIQLILDVCSRLITDVSFLADGLRFSLSVLFILICHEMGHYIACRIYKVDATLPYFIPTPPMIGPAGTLGAFIKIVSPMPSRKAVFDIGVAGPIAGFVALLPVAFLAISSHAVANVPVEAAPDGSYQIVFSDPLLYKGLAFFSGVDLSKPMLQNPYYFATWLGLLVTALNLIPSGQLDGGHAIYAVLGEKVHYWTGRIAFVVMAVLAVTGLYFYSSPSGFLFAIILAVMLKVRHPEPLDNSPIDLKRKIVALLTLVIFILCFVPFPVRLS